MAKFINISAHNLTPGQEEDAMRFPTVARFLTVHPGIVDPHASLEDVEKLAEDVIHEADPYEGDVAMVAGEPVLTMCIVKALQKKGVTCVAATTERISVERTLEDGSVVKQNVFNHVMFREFPPIN